jgi:hypothetical protein
MIGELIKTVVFEKACLAAFDPIRRGFDNSNNAIRIGDRYKSVTFNNHDMKYVIYSARVLDITPCLDQHKNHGNYSILFCFEHCADPGIGWLNADYLLCWRIRSNEILSLERM